MVWTISPRRFIAIQLAIASIILVGANFVGVASALAQNGCRTGAAALAGAYVRSNPLYALFVGDLRSYVANNRAHFGSNGDAVRCARVVAPAMLNKSVQAYDPNALKRQQALGARLGAMGLSPGPAQASPSVMFLTMSRQVSRLADVLPAAARGDYRPMNTPRTVEQRQRMVAGQLMVQMYRQDPTMRGALNQARPLIMQSANSEYQMVFNIARRLAN